jgi:Protein of unknown function (DUF3309)
MEYNFVPSVAGFQRSGKPLGRSARDIPNRVHLSKERTMLATILIVFLILALFGALPRWSHSRDWGYFPTGGVGLVLLVVVVLVLLGRL